MTTRALYVLCWLLLGTTPALAQRSAFSLDVGSARMRYADSINAAAISVSPMLRIVGAHGSLGAAGTFSQLDGASTNSGVLDAALSANLRRWLVSEIQGISGGSAHSDGARTGLMLGLARLHVLSESRGASVGGGVGRTWDGSWHAVVQGEVAAWIAGRIGSAAVSVAPTVIDDTIKYADALLSLHRRATTWDIGASVGLRGGSQLPSLPANRSVWGSVAVTRWLRPGIGVNASVGTYPVDFTQGYPGGQFVSLSLRLSSIRPARDNIVSRPAYEPASSDLTAFEVRRIAGDSYRLRVRAPSARTVELAGDFTRWAAVKMDRQADGWWSTTVSIVSRTNEVNVRLDGGKWRVPPGLPPLVDEFGGTSGLLILK